MTRGQWVNKFSAWCHLWMPFRAPLHLWIWLYWPWPLWVILFWAGPLRLQMMVTESPTAVELINHNHTFTVWKDLTLVEHYNKRCSTNISVLASESIGSTHGCQKVEAAHKWYHLSVRIYSIRTPLFCFQISVTSIIPKITFGLFCRPQSSSMATLSEIQKVFFHCK